MTITITRRDVLRALACAAWFGFIVTVLYFLWWMPFHMMPAEDWRLYFAIVGLLAYVAATCFFIAVGSQGAALIWKDMLRNPPKRRRKS